eukprot:1182696-Prorocentrum_minimum.AAC.1
MGFTRLWRDNNRPLIFGGILGGGSRTPSTTRRSEFLSTNLRSGNRRSAAQTRPFFLSASLRLGDDANITIEPRKRSRRGGERCGNDVTVQRQSAVLLKLFDCAAVTGAAGPSEGSVHGNEGPPGEGRDELQRARPAGDRRTPKMQTDPFIP